jgi:rubrerythrin
LNNEPNNQGEINIMSLAKKSFDRQFKTFSRRGMLVGGAITGVSTAIGLSIIKPRPTLAESGDLAILNAAIDLENQAIWAYETAGKKLSSTDVGKTILALALRNREDHIKHRNALAAVVEKLGGTPAPAQPSYDLSTYINAGEGNLDSDANIGKLALALEYDAALAYIDAFSQLKDSNIIAAAGTIAPDEASHVTAIRAVFRTLDPSVEYVPSAFVSADTRNDWILKV